MSKNFKILIGIVGLFLLIGVLDIPAFTYLGPNEEDEVQFEIAFESTVLLYVKIPEPLDPVERESKYGEPIHELLKSRQLGEVSGGGTMLNKDGSIEYIAVDVDTANPKAAIPLLIEKLKEIKAPEGTVIERYEPKKETINVY